MIRKKDTLREIRPPLGLMAISGYLKTFGHNVTIIDGEPDLLSEEETVSRTLKTQPEIVGVTSTTPEISFRIRNSSPNKEARTGCGDCIRRRPHY